MPAPFDTDRRPSAQCLRVRVAAGAGDSDGAVGVGVPRPETDDRVGRTTRTPTRRITPSVRTALREQRPAAAWRVGASVRPSGPMNLSRFVCACGDRWARSLSLGGPMSAALADLRRRRSSIDTLCVKRTVIVRRAIRGLTFVLMRSVELGRKSHGVSVRHSTHSTGRLLTANRQTRVCRRF